MNNMKFIAHSMALGAVFAGLSTQAAAFQQCGGTTVCDVDESGPFTQTPAAGGTGLVAPQQQPQQLVFGIAQFDRDAALALHPEAGSVDDIILKRVEVTLSIDLDSFSMSQFNDDNVPTPAPCDYQLQYEIVANLLANGSVGTPPLNLLNSVGFTTPVTIQPGQTVAHTLPDFAECPGTNPAFPYLGCVELSDSACVAQTSLSDNLAPWIGNGDINWTLQYAATSQQPNCPQGTSGVNSAIDAAVSVEYTYCVKTDIPEVVGCVCDRPSPNYRRPGSLLLFPEFDNQEGSYTVVTVTNTDCIANTGEDVQIEYVYIDADGCSEFNKTDVLTPCDTLTVVTSAHNPGQDRGFLYVFAKKPDPNFPNGTAITWNNLIGSQLIIQAFDTGFDYSMNPVVFRGLTSEGETNDLDGDGIRDLDNSEYEPLPEIITIPRFLGQDGTQGNPGPISSQLILIGLTGGARFETTACFTFYNDNEEVFSGEYTWECWDKPYLLDISNFFRNEFLKTTDHDLDEIFGWDERESGWMCIQGCAANSSQESIDDPAIYAALVEKVGTYGVADLPWECGLRTNGALLPRGVFGDPDVDTNGDGVVNEDDAVNGDNQ